MEEPQLMVTKEISDSRKEEELELIRRWKKRKDNRSRRSRMGEPVPIVCSVCKRGDITLYNFDNNKEEKRCQEHVNF